MNGEAHGIDKVADGRRNMSTTPSPDPEAGMPLTRRQRRALERAQQAQREAATGDLPAPSQPAVQARPHRIPQHHKYLSLPRPRKRTMMMTTSPARA